jgi:transposase
VPSDHLLRRIDQFLDLESVRAELRPFYSKIGRPSIDPELMMRMLIIGYSKELNCTTFSQSIRKIFGQRRLRFR